MPGRELIIIGVVLLLGIVVLGAIFLIPKNSNNHPPLECSPACSKDQKCVNGECKCACSPDEYCDQALEHCVPYSKCGSRVMPPNPPSGCTLDKLICPADINPEWPDTWRCPGPCEDKNIPYPEHRDGCSFDDLVCQDENGWFCPNAKNTYCNERGMRYLKIVDQHPDTTPCSCAFPYAGDKCQCSPHETCHDHGNPVVNPDGSCKCACDPISWGDSCENQCGAHSHYNPAVDPYCPHGPKYNCTCEEGYNHDCTSSDHCVPTEVCCGHGHKDKITGNCVCDQGFSNKDDPTCCKACQNGGTWKDGTCDCSTAWKPTSDTILDCHGNTVQKISYFTGPICTIETDCYNKVGNQQQLGLDSSNQCICPTESCGVDCKLNGTTCSCHGSPCNGPDHSSCKCDPDWEGDHCACHHPDIRDLNHGSNLPVEKTMCQNLNMLACTDTKVKPPCKAGGITVNNYCEIPPTNCTDWGDQMDYIGGRDLGKDRYSCLTECQARQGDTGFGDVTCHGDPPVVACQAECLDPDKVKDKCNSCDAQTQWCMCDGAGNPKSNPPRDPFVWGCDDIYTVENKTCMDGPDPVSCCAKVHEPDYFKDKSHCPDGTIECMDCGAQGDSKYGFYYYCKGLSKMPLKCLIHTVKAGNRTDFQTSTGQPLTLTFVPGDIPIKPTINNTKCLEGGIAGDMTSDAQIFDGEAFWDYFTNPRGNVDMDAKIFTDFDLEKNLYYNLANTTAEEDVKCMFPNPCQNGGNFNSKVTYHDAPTDGFLKDCTKGVCTVNSRFVLGKDLILKDGVCSCPDKTIGPNCEFTREHTCSNRGDPNDQGNCTCDTYIGYAGLSSYLGKHCQFGDDFCSNQGIVSVDGNDNPSCTCDGQINWGETCQYQSKRNLCNNYIWTGNKDGSSYTLCSDPNQTIIPCTGQMENEHCGSGEVSVTKMTVNSDHSISLHMDGSDYKSSGAINDEIDLTSFLDKVTWTTPEVCSGNGTMVNGACQCFPNFQGPACAAPAQGKYYITILGESPDKQYVQYDPAKGTYKGSINDKPLMISFARNDNADLVIIYPDPSSSDTKYLARDPSQAGSWSGYFLGIQLKLATTDIKQASKFFLTPTKGGYYLQYLGAAGSLLCAPWNDDDIDFSSGDLSTRIVVNFQYVDSCGDKCTGSTPDCCGDKCTNLYSDMNNCGKCTNDCYSQERQKKCLTFQGASLKCCAGTCFCCAYDSGPKCDASCYTI